MNAIIESLNSAGLWFVKFALPMLIQSSLLITVVLFLDLGLRKKVRAVVRYCLWMLILVKLVLPVTLAAPTGIGYWIGGDFLNPVIEQPSSPPPQVQVPVQEIAQFPELDITLPALHLAPKQEFARMDLQPPIFPEEVSAQPAEQPLQAGPIAAVDAKPVATVQEAKNVPITWPAIAFLIWVAIAAAMVLLIIQRSLFVRGLVRQAQEAGDKLTAMLEECKKRPGIFVKRQIKLKLSANATSPAVCGLFNPVILFPENLPSKLGPVSLKRFCWTSWCT